MPPTDDAFALQVLGRVQELRHELERLKDRPHARAFKAQLVGLHDSCRGDRVPFKVGKIVDEFFALAKASIVKSYGTSAWDEPATIEEARAHMGTLPAAPTMGTSPLEVAREAIAAGLAPLTDEELHYWAGRLHGGGGARLVAEVRRLRSDEWLARAATDIAFSDGTDHASVVMAILRKHRDGKLADNAFRACPACAGSGWQADVGGDGQIIGRKDCTVCAGTGRVPSPNHRDGKA